MKIEIQSGTLLVNGVKINTDEFVKDAIELGGLVIAIVKPRGPDRIYLF